MKVKILEGSARVFVGGVDKGTAAAGDTVECDSLQALGIENSAGKITDAMQNDGKGYPNTAGG